MLLIILFIILGFGVVFFPLCLNDSDPYCQFAGLTYTGQCYWYYVLLPPERYELQNNLDSAIAKLENWHKAINIQNLIRCITSNKIYLY